MLQSEGRDKRKGDEVKEVDEVDLESLKMNTDELDEIHLHPLHESSNLLLKKREGVELKDVEDTNRPRPTSQRSLLTLKPLPKIDPKDWEAEEVRNKIAEEEATNEALIKNFDDIKARIEADRILAEKLQEQEREQFTIEERAKFLHDTIAAQRKFLARQRSEAIRNRPPTKNQLRNQMMTYLKHVGNFKHSG
ncbi:hypothetical protein Tco_0471865 [Tanacetum coccineum]